ncbi:MULTISPECIES: GNAT family N-acetyltransferase [Pseudomonas]|uniref:GNAT family N-acetyltransferase n=1 Tax=Pseudomonas mosselii TaxID=78327 RepID=UPI0023F55A77|nr:GNAT family N-acetyltransferase [Pseudomonas mosselii]
MLSTSEIFASEEVRDLCLRERYVRGHSTKTRTFVVLQDGVEVGLLIYEDWGLPQGFIYEIFVLREVRGAGIGAWMLGQAESIASEIGCMSVKLTARSLDREHYSDEALIHWYERKGYVRCDPDSSDLTKCFSPPVE